MRSALVTLMTGPKFVSSCSGFPSVYPCIRHVWVISTELARRTHLDGLHEPLYEGFVERLVHVDALENFRAST